MTAFMWAARQTLRWHENYPLPPRQITMKLARLAEIRPHMTEWRRGAATGIAHFGFGGAMGALFGMVGGDWRNPVGGVAYGLAVWTANYLGLLPAAGILRPATEHPARHTALMIGAHIVWGATLGYLTDRIQRKSEMRQ
jgi:hypothetical protein